MICSSLNRPLAHSSVSSRRILASKRGRSRGHGQRRQSRLRPSRVRNGLAAGGDWIRTISSARADGDVRIVDHRVEAAASATVLAPRMVERSPERLFERRRPSRGSSLRGRLFHGGTDGSNPYSGAASAVCHRASTLVCQPCQLQPP